eukprot:NODE_2599_length_502_cov_188.492274_g2065_i0.p1 GENE.NODE_2599_length_502_cov_188.492274_g2065_i0~~NODE_2599_length_502_cov_188.492274_g2065_i0.p1  ORF type:complete len:143 (-),score=24.63 NODE_2599_length_502_cov_188.492274_g2065_i0:44-472(-)
MGEVFRPGCRLLSRLLCILAVAALCTAVSHTWVQPISRRLCNAAYASFTVTYNTLWVLGFYLVERVAPLSQDTTQCQQLVPAVNFNQLLCFLGGNLLTGLANLTLDTLNTPPHVALIVLFGYMGILALVLTAARHYHIRLKL